MAYTPASRTGGGEGGTGTVTDPRQEFRRQLRFVRRNLELIANLVRLRANLPIALEAHASLQHQRAKLRARLLTPQQETVIPTEARSAQRRDLLFRPLTRKCRS